MDETDRLIVDFIRGFAERHGYAPTVREILDATPGIKSLSTMHARLKRLIALRVLAGECQRARTLRVVT